MKNTNTISVIFAILVFTHIFLGIWAIVGWIEWFNADVPWAKVSNPLFSSIMLFVHWLAISSASFFFLFGWQFRWSPTGKVMIFIYLCMACICAYQTFYILKGEYKFHAMAAEYAVYSLIIYLFVRDDKFKSYFGA